MFEHRQEACELKVEKFKAKTIQKPSPDWTWPLLGTWKKQNNSAPYWAMHVSQLARSDSFIFSILTPMPVDALGFSSADAGFSGAILVFLCREVESVQTSWRKSGSVLFYLCLLFLLFNLLKVRSLFIPVTWQLCLAHKCSQINNSGLHMTS